MKKNVLVLGLCLIAFAMSVPSCVHAIEPQERLPDPKLEARAREISAELRCLVCQNQSIDDSDATLAKDLRFIVRERLKAGDSNEQVFDYLVARYGEFVLLNPRFSAKTLLLWLAPALLGAIGIALAARTLMYKPVDKSNLAALSSEEEAELKALVPSHAKPSKQA